MIRNLVIYVLIIALTLPSLYITQLFKPTVYVKPFSTSAVPLYGGILLDNDDAEKILNEKYKLSLKDIIIPYNVIYVIAPLELVGLYFNNTFYPKIKYDPETWEEINELFNKAYREEPDNCYMVVSPRYNELIIIGFREEVNIVHDPYYESKPHLLLYLGDNKFEKNFKWVSVLPLTIMDLDPNVTTFYIDLRLTNKTYDKNELISNFTLEIEEEEQLIEKHKDDPWILYEGPRVPGKIIYVDDWPVTITPRHEICNIVGDNYIVDQCLMYPTHLGTGYNGIWIVIHTYLGDSYAVEQVEIFLERLND